MESNFYKEKQTVDQYIKMAKGHDGRELIEELNHVIKPNAVVLELGSGPGSDYDILSKKYKVFGSDYSSEFLNRLKENYPEGSFLKLDAETLETELIFDVIYSNKVLHHLSDEELCNSINRQYEILSKDGIICHSFWKGNGTENFNGMFVNNHKEDELGDFFAQQFEILVLKTYAEFEDNDSIFLIARKK